MANPGHLGVSNQGPGATRAAACPLLARFRAADARGRLICDGMPYGLRRRAACIALPAPPPASLLPSFGGVRLFSVILSLPERELFALPASNVKRGQDGRPPRVAGCAPRTGRRCCGACRADVRSRRSAPRTGNRPRNPRMGPRLPRRPTRTLRPRLRKFPPTVRNSTCWARWTANAARAGATKISA